MASRTIVLRLGLAVVAILVLLAAAAAGFVAYLHSQPGERWLAGMAEDALSGPGARAKLDGFSVTWPFDFRAQAIRVHDEEGRWLTISRLHVDWSPSALLRRAVEIDTLSAESVVVHRRPETLPPEGGEEGGGAGLPDLAWRLNRVALPVVLEEPVLGERVDLALTGTFQMRAGGGEVDLGLRSGEGEMARLSGTARRDQVDLRWSLDIPELARWQRLAGTPMRGPAEGSGFVKGRLPRPAFGGSLGFGEGGIARTGWDAATLKIDAEPADGDWRGDLAVDVRSPKLDGERLAPSAWLEADFSARPDAGEVRIGDARLNAAGMAASVRGEVAAWGRRADVIVDLDVPDLGRLRDWTGIELDGGGRMRAHVTGDLTAPDLSAAVQVRGRRFASGIGVLDRLLGPDPRGRGQIRLLPDGRLVLAPAMVEGARASAQVRGEVTERLNLSARLTVPDLSVFAQTLDGHGVAEGRIAGTMDDLRAWGTGRFEGLAVAGSPPARGMAGFDFRDLAGDPAGRVTADLTLEGGIPLVGSARIIAARQVRIEDLRVSSGASRLAGGLTVDDGAVAGTLTASVPRLEQWRRFLGADASGGLEARALLDPAADQSMRLEARGRNLQWGDIRASRADLVGHVQGLDTDPRGRVRLDALGVTRADLRLERLTATAEGDAAFFRFQAEGAGAAASLATRGSARLEGPRGAAVLEDARFAVEGRSARMEGSTRVLWGPDGFILEPVAIAVDGGRIDAVARSVRGRLSGQATLRDVPLDLVHLALPDVEVAGTVDGRAELGGTPDAPVGRLSLTGRRLAFAAAARAGVDWLDGRLDATLANGRVVGDAALWDREALRAEAVFSVPVEDPKAPLSGRVTITGDVQRLTEVLPLAGHQFQGRIEGDVRLAGTRAAPRLEGRVDVARGRYDNFEQGTVIDALSATALFDSRSATITAQGTDGGRGNVRLDGRVDFGEDTAWRGQLGLEDFRLVRRDDIRGVVQADLSLAGRGTEGALTGSGRITEAEVNIERLAGGGPTTLDVIEINRPAGSASPAPQPDEGEAPVVLALDLDVAVARAFVRGRGLDSEWQGNLQVTGTVDDPRLAGMLTVQRGRFELLGRVFRLDPESAVSFEPDQGPDQGITPRLAVSATTRARDITAQVAVTGTPDEPRIEITSDPALPQEEILARVLFDAEAGRLSAFQQIQLAQMAAAGLGGPGAGFDPIGGIRGMLGLDVLELGLAEGPEGGPTLGIGRYIGDDTFLRLDQGTRGGGRVTVERELGRGFSVTTQLGSEAGGGVGLEWRRDY